MKYRAILAIGMVLALLTGVASAQCGYTGRSGRYVICENAGGSTAGSSTAGSSQSAMEAELVRQVNADRAKNGLRALTVSQELSRAAQVRAKEIVEKFSHTRPNGSRWTTVSSAARGENIAKGQQSVDKVMAAWMSSQGHRANILRASFGSIGVCAYKQGNVMYWVQLFGK